MILKKAARIVDAALELTPAVLVDLKAHRGYSEDWLERQITKNPAMLGLTDGKLEVVRTQLRQDKERRLDLLLKAPDEGTYYSVELMLGELNASHLVRTVDYWLRNKDAIADKDWEHVPVVVAERISETGWRRVARWLADVSPLIAIELRAISVDSRLAVQCFTVFDGRDHQEELDIQVPQVELGPDYWVKKASEKTVAVAQDVGSILPKIDSKLRLSYKQEFIGVMAQNRPANFVTFNPKKSFVRARVTVTESETWAKRLKKAGVDVFRVKSGKSVHFRLRDKPSGSQRKVLKEMFQAAFEERFPDPE